MLGSRRVFPRSPVRQVTSPFQGVRKLGEIPEIAALIAGERQIFPDVAIELTLHAKTYLRNFLILRLQKGWEQYPNQVDQDPRQIIAALRALQ